MEHTSRCYKIYQCFQMALLCYYKPVNGLPNPKRLLSTTVISPETIAEMNKEVEEASHSTNSGKCGPYKTYSSPEWSQFGKLLISMKQ